jgi:hypothetical protein
MDKRTIENWTKVKDALEAAGKTDCWFYRRAVTVIKTGRDPGLGKLGT